MKRLFLLFVISVVCFQFVSSQSVVVKGKVTDSESGDALPGAYVILNNETGVVTDFDGNYSINCPADSVSLTFSYIGYESQKAALFLKQGQTFVKDILLKPSIKELGVIVVSAGKFEQKLEEVTVSMEVMKPKKIEDLHTRSIETAISLIPGVDVTDGQPSIRGGSGYSYGAGSRVLLLVDDLPMLSADAGDIKWNYIPLENLEQIEVLKGASSALFGSSALNGVINVRTAYPRKEPETKVSIYSGLYMNPKRDELIWWGNNQPLFSGSSFSHSRRIGQLDLVLGANVFADQGYREQNNEEHYRGNLNLRYRDKKVKGLSYGMNANYMYHDKISFFLWQNADSGAYRQLDDAVNRSEGTRMNLDPFIVYYSPNGDRHNLRTRYFRVTNFFKDNADKNNNADLYYAEYQYQKRIKEGFTVTAGLSGTYANSVAELFGDHQSRNGAVYAQLDKKFGKLWISLGGRYEMYSLDTLGVESSPVFRSGLNYQLASHSYLRASFGQGYRFPSIAEKYTATSMGGMNIFPNPDLVSESGYSAELGFKQGLRLADWKGFFDIALFYTEYKDMMEFTFGLYVPDSVQYPTIDHLGFKSINVGNARISGVEMTLSGTGKIAGFPVTVLMGYTYTDPVDLNISDDSSRSNVLNYRFYHSFKGDIGVSKGKFDFGVSAFYHSAMVNVDPVFLDPAFGDLILPGFADYWEDNNKDFVVWDVRLGYHLSEKIIASVSGKNLLNKEYMTRPGDIRPPRNVSIQMNIAL